MKTPSRAAAGLDRASLDALAGLGARIRAARTNLGWTRDALADRILCRRATLQRLEQGDPRVATGVVIADGAAVGVAAVAETDAATQNGRASWRGGGGHDASVSGSADK